MSRWNGAVQGEVSDAGAFFWQSGAVPMFCRRGMGA